jgi:hypothetical protein
MDPHKRKNGLTSSWRETDVSQTSVPPHLTTWRQSWQLCPTMDYWKQTIEGKKGSQFDRMKSVRIFNPLNVLGNKISESDIMGWRYSSYMNTLRFVRRLLWWKPNSCGTRLWLTPSSHWRKGRITRARTHSTCLIGGSQTTVQLTKLLSVWESLWDLQCVLQWRSEEVSHRLHWIIDVITV